MPERLLRFGISDGQGHRAATWRVWTASGAGKSDLYLTCRGLGGVLKASLHESGKWHMAYTQKTFEDVVQGAIANHADRFMYKWSRPDPIGKGCTLAFRIVTPYSAVRTQISEFDKEVMWLPNALEREATEIGIFLTSSETEISGWPGKRSMGTSLIGSIGLENGETVWAVYRVIEMPDLSAAGKGRGQFYKGRGREELESDDIRALAIGYEKDGSCVLYDCPVQGIQG